MPRRLLVLNVALGLVSLFFAVGIVRALLVKHPLPKPTVLRAVAPTPPVAPATASTGRKPVRRRPNCLSPLRCPLKGRLR